MDEPVDRKFTISATCHEHSHHHTEWDSILFLAKDKAVPATLLFYRSECERLGAEERQLLGIDLLIERVDRWQAEHPHRLKIPDVDAGAVGDAIVAPNKEA